MALPLRRLGAVLMVSALAITGCSRASDSESGSSASEGSNDRVAALGLGDSDTLLALGVTPSVVAPFGSEGEVDPSGVGPWAKDLLGDAKPTVIYNTSAGFSAEIIEQVTAADPSKIIAVNTAMDDQAVEALEKIAPTTLKPEDATNWQIPWDTQVTTIAGAVDKGDEGKELIEKTEKAFEDFKKEHPEVQGKTAAIVLPYDGQIGLYTSGDGRGQMVEDMGFEIPDSLEGDGDTFYRAIAPENYDELNEVDYLFVLDYNGSAEALKNDETFKNLDVTRDGRVRYLDSDTGTAMSMPNPVTIPWAIEKFSDQL
ncbi:MULTISPECIES: ABC transporter substrate-binding protein [unclassified Corynebacterium]|uniref:ABC transporter substrate-binding protein n=1 Tax=unclassified Corynebacterium TaxID=2624378 RepID=UPI0029CA2CF4|nr:MULTISPECIES: ABC transporter substrate-binding protein [unclassified Corynebacterium]WPF65667.1 ABC transporter substrate-binding protein [Corynebacterium sp. 22KM0430]WPF68163.1 ABC transporter substrate-binding protein [Corynebacterium sp. 21KM1197]